MRALVFFTQLLLVLLILRIALRGIASLFVRPQRQPRSRPQASAAPPRQIEDLVLDRICHTHFPRSQGVRATIGGHEELFCSAACRDKAVAQVARAAC